MGARAVLVFLFVLCASWVCDGRWGRMHVSSGHMNENQCNLCLKYASRARNYFSDLKNQNEMMETLRQTCSRLPPRLTQMCIASVDLYAPVVMSNFSSIHPEGFCFNDNHCERYAMRSIDLLYYLKLDSCGVCHLAVEEAFNRLKDPDMQLKITGMLLDTCDSSDEYEKMLVCKKMVFENGPALFTNLEQYVEVKDLCTNFCGGCEQISQVVEKSGHSDF